MKKRQSIKFFKELGDQKPFGFTPLQLLAFILLISVGSILQSFHFLSSAVLSSQGIIYNQFHDALWHLSIINEIGRQFPLQNPGLSGIPLHNYHFLSDLIWFAVHKITSLPVEEVYFHVAPPIVSALFITSLFALSKTISKSNSVALVATLFAFVGGSAAYLIPILTNHDAKWFANSFMLDQPFEQLTNVHTILGFSVFLFATNFLLKYLESLEKKFGVVSGILFGIVTAIKAYAGVVAVISLITTLILEIIIRKKKSLILPTLIATTIFILLTLAISKSQNPPLVFSPGWTLEKMVHKISITSNPAFFDNFMQLKQHYKQAGNILRIAQLNLTPLFIYLVGNLGTRILAFFWIGKKIINWKKAKTFEIFLTVAIVASLSIPLITIQPVSAYNTTQFSPYSLMLMSLVMVIWLYEKKAKAVIFIILFLLTIPTTLKSFFLSTREHHVNISIHEYNALKVINTFPDNSIVLTSPHGKHVYFMIVPGIGGKRTYFSGDDFAMITSLENDYQDRLKLQKEFFALETPLKKRKEILENAKITHIYADDKSSRQVLELLEKESFPIISIFNNHEVGIFKVL